MSAKTHNPVAKTISLLGVCTGIMLLIGMSIFPAKIPLHSAAPTLLAASPIQVGANAHVILGMLLILIGLSVHGLFLLKHEHPIHTSTDDTNEEHDAVLYAERQTWFEEGNLS